ncbi:hypothetical protein CDAR_401511 [Caerostris darwini]|uniref:Uncharacterized protein n=1 Tax=Caerostris darwini TaxID=1538125 RepID=A0AAV4RTE7_9ARAC|nr:hypothetical protein CDAR_401511 [Caerostris darwini]
MTTTQKIHNHRKGRNKQCETLPLQAAFLYINAEVLTYKCGVTTLEGTFPSSLQSCHSTFVREDRENKIKEVSNKIFRKVSPNSVRKVLPLSRTPIRDSPATLTSIMIISRV